LKAAAQPIPRRAESYAANAKPHKKSLKNRGVTAHLLKWAQGYGHQKILVLFFLLDLILEGPVLCPFPLSSFPHTTLGEHQFNIPTTPIRCQMHIAKPAVFRTSFFRYQMRVANFYEIERHFESQPRADPERRRGFP